MENLDEKKKLIIVLVVGLIVGLILGYIIGAQYTKHKISKAIEDAFSIDSTSSESSKDSSKKEKVSKDKITVKEVGYTKSGDLVVEITNKNKVSAAISEININFMDEDGEFAVSKTLRQYYFAIPAGETVYGYVDGYSDDLKSYPSFEYDVELAYSNDSIITKGIEATAKDTGKQISVTVENNSGKELNDISVVVVYYKGEDVVGIKDGHTSSAVEDDENGYINVNYPVNKKFEDVKFDKFETYVLGGRISEY